MPTTDSAPVFTPIPFTQVMIADDFWAPRLRANRENTLPAQYRHCVDTGRLAAYKLAWTPGQEPEPHIFWDSDVAKWVEAVSYSLATHPDPELETLLDDVVALIVSAQQPDGYLNVHFPVVEPEKRWTNLRDLHELYCAGHLIEAAVAHFQATGKRTLLDALCRYADYINTVFGMSPEQLRGYCGHEEIELALIKLYQATGEVRYLHLSAYFVNERGQQPHYFDEEARRRGEDPKDFYFKDYTYCQAKSPVRDLREVGGHAVRAMYLYSAMTDLAGELGDASLKGALHRLWDDLTLRKMYLTGGIGPSAHNEGFTTPYDLPNLTAYAESCAAIGLVFWCHRLANLEGDARYIDVLERALYNNVMSSVSLNGDAFFYENPLASVGAHHRQPWFGCACCPPNVARLLASLGQYCYARTADGLAVQLYVQGRITTTLLAGTPISLAVETAYPWEGLVKIRVEDTTETPWSLRLRIPGWCRNYTLLINGKTVKAPVVRGYAEITRVWQSGDVATLELAMPIERMEAHPNVISDRGCVALQRGPIVYCLEAVDHQAPVEQLILPADAQLTARFATDCLGGVTVVEGEALVRDLSDWQGVLYQPTAVHLTGSTPLRAIPYGSWDNRASGAMTVWIPTA